MEQVLLYMITIVAIIGIIGGVVVIIDIYRGREAD